MFRITFNTENFQSKKRRDWEDQLRNDFAVALNGKEFICDTELDLENRLSFIAGTCFSDKNEDLSATWDEYHNNEDNYFDLENDRYNHQRLKYGMYGIPQGYVNFDEILKQVKGIGELQMPFSSFYDIRQGNFFKGCFLEITAE